MAVNEKDGTSYIARQRTRKHLSALAGISMLGIAGAGGYYYYEDVYLPERATAAATANDYQSFFDTLSSLDHNYTGIFDDISSALNQLYRDGGTLSDESFMEIVDNHLNYELAHEMIGVAVLENNQDRVHSLLQHYRFSISDVTINFEAHTERLNINTIRQAHSQNPYSDTYAAVILLNAHTQERNDIEEFILSEFDFSSINLAAVMTHIPPQSMEELLNQMHLSDDQEVQMLSIGLNNNTAITRYALAHYEYSDEEYRAIFTQGGHDDFDLESMTLLLENFTPSENDIIAVFNTAYERRYFNTNIEKLSQIFTVPEEIANRLYLNAAENNNYRDITEIFNTVTNSDVRAQGYINAARNGNDEVMFVLDNMNIELTQAQIDDAFAQAANHNNHDIMRQIALNHKISDNLAHETITSLRNSNSNISREFAREIEQTISLFNRYYTTVESQQSTPAPVPTTPATPEPPRP